MTDIKNFGPNLLKICKIPFKSLDAVIYSIKCITMKSLDNVNIVNYFYLVFNNVDEYIEESN